MQRSHRRNAADGFFSGASGSDQRSEIVDCLDGFHLLISACLWVALWLWVFNVRVSSVRLTQLPLWAPVIRHGSFSWPVF
jgi:hypothetical protein